MDTFRHKQLNGGRQPTLATGFRCVLSLLLILAIALTILGCGGGSSNPATNNSPIAGNWQFTLTPPTGTPPPFSGDPSASSPSSVLQGGFLVVQNGSITGQAVFSIWVTSQAGSLTECNSGTATITGTVGTQTVNLTATVGTLASDGVTPANQTFTLSGGQLSSDNSTIQGGTYSSTAGYYVPQGSTSAAPCGDAQTGLNWSAALVPSITGTFQGFFHSTHGGSLGGQVFPVTGSLNQGTNIGASSATVTGSLVFTGYSCLSKATVNGEISGNTVVLQIFNSSSGLDAGQIGGLNNGAGITYPVTFNNTSNGYTLQNSLPGSTVAYALATSSCPLPPGGVLGASENGDAGNICLGFGTGNQTTGALPCTEPITLSPGSVTFPAQPLASESRTRQTLTLANIQPAGSSPLNISLRVAETDGLQIYTNGGGDFNGFPNFAEQDTCGTSLAGQQSCTITISFLPQQSCPWLPSGSNPAGLAPAKCPGLFNQNVPPKFLLSALLQVTIPKSSTPDQDSTFSIPIKGSGLSAVVPSTPELDFGTEAPGESSSQSVTFTNQSANAVQILSALTGSALQAFQQACNDYTGLGSTQFVLPRPPQSGATLLPGLVVVATNGSNGNFPGITPDTSVTPPSLQFFCDFDKATGLGSFQISSDSCSGTLLGPAGSQSDSCALTITFSPQPDSYLNFPNPNTQGGLDYFLELNTVQCDLNDSPPLPPPGPSNPCEVDSGRFPVELTANPPSPLRMSPAAGLNFGAVLRGTTSTPSTITLTNDNTIPVQLQDTVDFTGTALTGADYFETGDTCTAPLAPGESCELTFTLTPTISGFDAGNVVINYNASGSSGNQYNLHQYIYLRGIGQ